MRSTLPEPAPDEEEDEPGTLAHLTRDWRGGDTGWTTYFPKKVSELGAGWGSAAVASKPADRLDISVVQHGLYDESIATTSENPTAAVGSFQLKHGTVGISRTLDELRVPAELVESLGSQGAHRDAYALGEEFAFGHHGEKVGEHTDLDPIGSNLANAGHVGSRQHFALPTESWANRTSTLRGLYFNHGAGAGRGEVASRDRWPRKRSSGTTMRMDDERPDLRLSSEEPRPSTAPARITEAMKHGMQGTKSFPIDVISCRLSSRSSG